MFFNDMLVTFPIYSSSVDAVADHLQSFPASAQLILFVMILIICRIIYFFFFFALAFDFFGCSIAACAAATIAIGILCGEALT